MIETTKFLVEKTSAAIGYTQSDEISLLWYAPSPESQIYFNGRVTKMVGDLTALATLYFNKYLEYSIPEKISSWPRFDARVFVLPSKAEVGNYFLWRERDATRNSISMAARAYYSHNEVNGKNSSEKQEMLFQKGVNWNDYPSYFKRGTFVERAVEHRPFTQEEINSLPEKHEARTNLDLKIERSTTKIVEDWPSATSDRVEFLFRSKQSETV
jgi:tRNA(His) guanylyltransferase